MIYQKLLKLFKIFTSNEWGKKKKLFRIFRFYCWLKCYFRRIWFVAWEIVTTKIMFKADFFLPLMHVEVKFIAEKKKIVVSLSLTDLKIVIERNDVKKRKIYKMDLTPTLSFGIMSALAYCNFTPDPHDPLYSDEKITKGYVLTEEQVKNLKQFELEEAARREKEFAEQMSKIEAEMKWDEDFTDLSLFGIYGMMLVIAWGLYKKSRGGGGGGGS